MREGCDRHCERRPARYWKEPGCINVGGAGFEVKDLGVDVPVEDFLRVTQEEKPDIIALSALLTTTMPMIKKTIEAFVAAGLRDKVKIIVGGAPVTETYANQIGADGFSPDASRAVGLVHTLMASVTR